ncbi:MAG: NAD-dependent epimerase/dehydratase family protein [Candidatus Electrothrix sp. EH2]|nr:NAD-dependent epimerase/dehydratase family protein [Candidatus Electrothrix sp. EH2]
MSLMKNKTVLVTGACGTVGSELVRQLLSEPYEIRRLFALDNNESELFFLEQKFLLDQRAAFFLADIRDRDKLTRVMRDVDIIFHAAAFKHVALCERSPYEAVQSNVIGVQNIIQAARDNKIERVIFTSTDKAVNPTSVMGTSKLMGEKLIAAANSQQFNEDSVIFTSTRFGNVLGSRGSVIPIFKKQIAQGGPVTLTSSEMTRFIMSIQGAVRLVIDSALLAKGGEVLITKMPVIRIKDLAEVMIAELAGKYGHRPCNIPIEIIGGKPGEKLYEELMSQEEARRSIELQKYFSVVPAFRGIYQEIDYTYPDIITDQVIKPYNSAEQQCLTQDQLKNFLITNNLLETETISEHPNFRYWPGEKK